MLFIHHVTRYLPKELYNNALATEAWFIASCYSKVSEWYYYYFNVSECRGIIYLSSDATKILFIFSESSGIKKIESEWCGIIKFEMRVWDCDGN